MRASDFDLLIVPRLGGAAEGDWSSRWRGKLSTARFVAPDDPSDARQAAWVEAIQRAAREAERPILLIGHGLGAAAIVASAERLEDADVRGAFLVGPPDEAGVVRLTGEPWTVPGAKLPWPSVVVASRNDPESHPEAAASQASGWGAELIDAGEAGGLDAASGHGPWPEGLMRLAGFMKRVAT